MSTGLIPRRALTCAACVLPFVSPAAWCQQSPPESQPGAAPPQLEQVIVTASRVPEPEDQSFFSVTVLTRADIEARQVSTVQDLLADLPGINIDSAGGLGQQSSVFMLSLIHI